MDKIVKVDPAVSIQMREIMDKVWEAEKLSNCLDESIRQLNTNARERLNEMAYQLAQKTGRSIWDICFCYAPEYEKEAPTLSEEDGLSYKFTAHRNLKLVSIEHDLRFLNLVWEMRMLQKEYDEELSTGFNIRAYVESLYNKMRNTESLVDKWLEGNYDGTDETMP